MSVLERQPSPPQATVEEAAGTYLRALRRYWTVVLGAVALSVGIALFTIWRSSDTFEASASILVSPLGGADATFAGTGVVTDTGDPVRTVQTAAALIDAPSAAALAAATMGRGWTEARVRDAVSVTPRGQSNVLAVTALAPSASEASELANAFATSAVSARSKLVLRNIQVKLRALEARLRQFGSGETGRAGQQELAARIAQLEAVRATGGDPTLRVSQAARPPTSPNGLPNWFLVVLSGVVGFALGSVGAVVLTYFSPRVGDEVDISLLLPVPVLGAVPQVAFSERRHGLSPISMSPFVFEQIRKVRAQIPRENGGTVLMVTSADVGDGKTTVAAGLATAFAEADEEVILLDLDLRRPRISKLFGLEPSVWRSNELDAANLARMLRPVPMLPHVKVFSLRAANIAVLERLVGQLPKLLDEARGLAEWIVLDTPPLGEVSDGLRFAPNCDSVLLVVRARRTDRSRLVLAYNQLTRIGARIVGTVVNDHRRLAGRTPYAGEYHGAGWELPEHTRAPGGRWGTATGTSSRSASSFSSSD